MLVLLAEPFLWRPLSLPPGPLSLLPDSTPGSTPGSTGHVPTLADSELLPPSHQSFLTPGSVLSASLSSCKRSDKRSPVSALMFLCNGSLLSVSLPNILVFI